MKNVLGTNHFTGLDVSKGSHLIADGSLTKSVNGWTDESGVVRVARGQDNLYSGYSAISCFAAGRQDGTDKLVWMDGDNVYANGSLVGTIASDADAMYMRDFDDNFYVMGSTDDQNYIYDGAVVRQHGCWQLDSYDLVGTFTGTASTTTIVDISNASQAVFEMTAGHAIVAGDPFYVESCTGMTEFNGRIVEALSVSTNDVTVDENSSGYGTYDASTGTAIEDSFGNDGVYKYYMVPIVKFADDTVLSGKPRGLIFDDPNGSFAVGDSWEASALTLTVDDKVLIEIEFTPDYTCSGTVGVDYFPGLRLYRTKADGANFYLEREWVHGDGHLLLTGSEYTVLIDESITYRSTTKDINLGAVYLPDGNAHDTPPQSSYMALVGQRLFMNDVDNPDRLYFTGLDGVDYVGTLDYLLIPDHITGIGSVGSVCVVFSADRMWRVSMLGGIPDMDEIETSVGTDYGEVMVTTHLGLLFLRKDGLWVTDGASPPKHVGREAFASINEPTTITAAGDVLYVGDKNTAYIMQDKAESRNWHEHLVYHTLADATNGRFYAASATSVYELMAGIRGSAEITTKDWTDYTERQLSRVVLDYEGSDVPQVWVNGNRESDYDGHPDEGTDREGQRRLLRFSIPRLQNHIANIRITMSGDGALFGAWLEGE